MEPHLVKKEVLFEQLETSQQGLTTQQAQERNNLFGYNHLKENKKLPLAILFLLQLKDVMTIILLIAAIISGFFGEYIDMIIIFAVVLLNAVIGLIQEGKAEKSINELKKLSSQMAKVYRDGKIQIIDSIYLTIGDIVVIESGDSIPVDLRIIESHNLQIIESSLTGESYPIEKVADELDKENIAIADQINMAFMGTSVSYGRGVGVVVAIGMDTQIGKIATILNQSKSEITPLQKQLDKVGEFLSIAIITICIGIFLINIFRLGTSKEALISNLMLSVSLAVAAIPEGLSSVITLVLSIGVTSMAKKRAIVRRLRSIETLGCAQIICSDKTGTLTQNRMSVVKGFTLNTSQDYDQRLLRCAILCNDAIVQDDGIKGDPTEVALIEHGQKLKINKKELENKFLRVDELPFDSTRKMMSTFHQENQSIVMYTKGALDEVLLRSSYILIDNEITELTRQLREQIIDLNNQMATQALRVLAFAYKMPEVKDKYQLQEEEDLIFLGLLGMIDPIREEVKPAVIKATRAGIRTIMITGDHLITAVSIGKELGIINSPKQAITGKELDNLSDYQFSKIIDNYSVYARVSPENKVRIVKAWKEKGKVVAMTGDGVNDAPALKNADIGIGMGITGTDVTKGVADIVLMDDNFSTIVMAVEEGRKIYLNIKKTVQFLLSSNACEVLTLLIATILGFNILTPVMILWVNLVTDTIPALALGLEEAEDDIMEQPPRDSKQNLLSNGVGVSIIYQSVFLSTLVLISYLIGIRIDHKSGETMAFLTLSLSQIFHSFNLKSMKKSVINKHLFNNFTLNYGLIIILVITIAIVYLPFTNYAFGLKPLPLNYIIMSVVLSFSIIPIVEIVKWLNTKIEFI